MYELEFNETKCSTAILENLAVPRIREFVE